LITDLNHTETTMIPHELTLALMPRKKKITLLSIEKKLPLDYFENILALATEGCIQLHTLMDGLVYKRTVNLSHSRELSFHQDM
jgi:exosome complex component RRP41